MQERPRVVVSRSPQAKAAAKDFAFAKVEALPALDGPFAGYRTKAWEAYGKQALPDVTMEPWRRTDLRALPLDSFQLPLPDAYRNLPAVPNELLRPLIADQHGGQIVLMAGGSSIDLD